MADLDRTPAGMRTHIGIFGRTNSGKSSVLNMLTGSDTAIVSSVAGTTTDPVKKSMEMGKLGPVLLIDTPGTFDPSSLSEARKGRMIHAMENCDIALIVVNEAADVAAEKARYEWFASHKVATLFVYNEPDGACGDEEMIRAELDRLFGAPAVLVRVNAKRLEGRDALIGAIVRSGGNTGGSTLLGDLVKSGDTVLLVMPQDELAPKGRLILPQVMTIRELLDRDAVAVCTTPGQLDKALCSLKEPPKLIITDSQVFAQVYEKKPEKSILTSFSILMASLKGDIAVYARGAASIADLHEGSRVLIAESCTHAPADEDIGRVKIPAMIRKRFGEGISFDVCAGEGFPEDLSGYDLIIQCGGCMAGRRLIMSRIERASDAGIPITNYGIAIAYLKGILDKVYIP